MIRRRVVYFLAANLFVLGYLVHIFWPLICLLTLTGEEDRITRGELPAMNSDEPPQREEVIPKIIHQTYITCPVNEYLSGECKTKPIPEVWREAYQSCKDLHADYEYKLWEDGNSREFIATNYPWFLEVWDNYPYPIQRADAIRYFAMDHYGGIYIDLDDGCRRRLDPLRTFHMWARLSTPRGIGNDIIGSVPHHPFIQRVMKSLPRYNVNWHASPYITIMGSTGPLFFTIIWRQYNKYQRGEDESERIRILFPEEYMSSDTSFFIHHVGNSWHMWDAEAIFFLRKYWLEVTILGFAVGGAVILGLWYLWNAISRRRGLFNSWRYTPLKEASN